MNARNDIKGFSVKCDRCGSHNVAGLYDEGWCGTYVTPGNPPTIEIVCQDCGSSWEDGEYTPRTRFPSAQEPQ